MHCAVLRHTRPGRQSGSMGQENHRHLRRCSGNPRAGSVGGTYVFKLADTLADRHIVQIWNADETQIFATIRTIPNTRFEPPDKTIFEFDERSGDSPRALKVWFYPGDSTGQEFIYSRYSYNH